MSDDKIAEIRARHERDNRYGDGLYPGAHKDRAWLLAEVERLRADNERLTRERNEARAEYARLCDDIERIENDAWHDGAKHGTSH